MTLQLSDQQIHDIYQFVEKKAGITFSDRKKERVESQIEKRLAQLKLEHFADYWALLNQYSQFELPHLISALTIHHTHFFREKSHLLYLENQLLKPLAKKPSQKSHHTLRIWCGACSTGEEPYSLAMTLDAYFRDHHINKNFEIWATDIDSESVKRGENAVYRLRSYPSIPKPYQRRYCEVERSSPPAFFRIKNELRQHIKWATTDLKSPHESLPTGLQFDAIFMRNVFIYFSPQEVENCVNRIEKFLVPGGTLFIGQSENLFHIKSNFRLLGQSIYTLPPPKRHPQREKPSLAKTPKPKTQATSHAPNKDVEPLRVMIVDDSQTIHKVIEKILSQDPHIQIVAQAMNGQEALEILEHQSPRPDAIISDINMPDIDGIELLKRQMPRYRIPTLIVSAISEEDATSALKAFEWGAIEYIEKPKTGDLSRLKKVFLQKLYSTAQSRSQSPVLAPETLQLSISPEKKLLLIGSSTGGPQALQILLGQMPQHAPPILIAQHMPPVFTKALANQLNTHCKITVTEAANGEDLQPGHAYIGPGGYQMKVQRNGHKMKIQLHAAQPEDLYSPSVNTLFESAAPLTQHISIAAAILTGMGDDGTLGAKLLHSCQATVLGQNQDTSVVFGMAKAAQKAGALSKLVPLSNIARELLEALSPKESKAA